MNKKLFTLIGVGLAMFVGGALLSGVAFGNTEKSQNAPSEIQKGENVYSDFQSELIPSDVQKELTSPKPETFESKIQSGLDKIFGAAVQREELTQAQADCLKSWMMNKVSTITSAVWAGVNKETFVDEFANDAMKACA